MSARPFRLNQRAHPPLEGWPDKCERLRRKNKAKTGPGRSNPAVLKDQISANRAERLSRGLYGQDSGHGTEPFNGTGFDQGLTGGRR